MRERLARKSRIKKIKTCLTPSSYISAIASLLNNLFIDLSRFFQVLNRRKGQERELLKSIWP